MDTPNSYKLEIGYVSITDLGLSSVMCLQLKMVNPIATHFVVWTDPAATAFVAGNNRPNLTMVVNSEGELISVTFPNPDLLYDQVHFHHVLAAIIGEYAVRKLFTLTKQNLAFTPDNLPWIEVTDEHRARWNTFHRLHREWIQGQWDAFNLGNRELHSLA